MGFDSCYPNELVVLSALLSIAFSENLNADQQNVLGNLLCCTGQNILTLAAANQSMENQQPIENNGDLQKQIDDLKKYVKKLENKIN